MPEEPEEVLDQEEQEAPEGEEQAPDAQEQTVSPEVETEARETGWVPQEEFKGDPAKWRPAAEWVERGKRILTIVQPRLKKAEEENAALRDELRMTKKAIEEVKERADREARERYERKLAALQEAQRDAAAAGDVEEYDAIEEAKAKLKPPDIAAAPEGAKPAEGEKPQADTPPWLAEWEKRNSWWNSDDEMSQFAIAIEEVTAKTTGKRGEALFAEIAERVKRQFSDRFTNPRREEAGTVEGGGAGGSGARQVRGGNGDAFPRLPQTAKATYERQVKEWKDRGQEFPFTKDQFAREWASD